MASRIAPKKAAGPELNRTTLVTRALAIADEESLDAVTIRRLATDFGVTPMALYWHFKNKDELLAAMGDAFFTDLELSELDDAERPWPDRLQAVLDLLVGRLRQHPASTSLAAPRILITPRGLELTERTLQFLHEAGFDVQEAADVARTALQTALMLVSGMPGAEFWVAAEEREAVRQAKRASIAQLPADAYPRVRESVDVLMACDDVDGYFSYGTGLFVAGVISRHARLAGSAR